MIRQVTQLEPFVSRPSRRWGEEARVSLSRGFARDDAVCMHNAGPNEGAARFGHCQLALDSYAHSNARVVISLFLFLFANIAGSRLRELCPNG